MKMNKIELEYYDGSEGWLRTTMPEEVTYAVMHYTAGVRHAEQAAREKYARIGVSMVGSGTGTVTLTVWGYNRPLGDDGEKFATVTLTLVTGA